MRKVFPRAELTVGETRQRMLAKERIEAGDKEYTKFLELKP